MEFHEAANFLFDLRRFAPRPGLDPTRDLLAHLDDPQDGVQCVQIAGSNGKGSTARMVERSLREAGLSVGLYTSPHLDDVRERVRVDGRVISKAAVTEFVTSMREYADARATDGESPTFFETITALALWEFDRQDVDVAVLEVGIGGALDATSVVDPVASAVTAVTLEHTDVLGDTVEEIARDKAGVAPADAPLVTGTDGDALAAIRDEVGEVLTVADASADRDADVRTEYGGREGLEGVVSVSGPDWRVDTRLPLLGAHQARNAGVAATLVHQVADVDATDLERGLRNAHWPGRFEVMGRDPLVVLDGAHNPGGCETLVDVLASFEYDHLTVVTGAMTDKDHRGIAGALAEADPDRVVTCRADHERAEDETVLARAFDEETDAAVESRAAVTDALTVALADATESDAIVVAGSLHVVAEARTRWARHAVPKRVESLGDAVAAMETADVSRETIRERRGSAVHRVRRTRVRPRQARALRTAMLEAGGECTVSTLNEQDRETVDVLLLGTLSEYERFLGRIETKSGGLAAVAEELRSSLGVEAARGTTATDAGVTGTDAGSTATDAGSTRSGDAESTSTDETGSTRSGDAESTSTDETGSTRRYPWDDGTTIMGILNITPDSFHDGGEYNTVAAARERAERMVDAGVDILDVGGESTRPGADVVPAEEERARVVPVVEAIADLDVMISIDTRKADVARAALDAGADVLNDVSGLADPEMRLVAADYDVPVVVMHSIETPVDPDTDVHYDDVVSDVLDSLTERVLLAEKAGLDRSQILVDPGLGFGKSAAESFELLDRLGELRALGCPILIGHSHKSMFQLVDGGRENTLDETVAATALAADRGADVIRVHDAHENVAAVRVAKALDDPQAFE